MKPIPSLGEQEMEILKHISESSGAVSVREVAAHFEQSRGLARATVLTVMERLRKKGFLKRAKIEGVFKYSSKMQTSDIITKKISDFVDKTLGGSMSPLLSYFSSSNLSEDEIRQLKEIAAKLDKQKGDL